MRVIIVESFRKNAFLNACRTLFKVRRLSARAIRHEVGLVLNSLRGLVMLMAADQSAGKTTIRAADGLTVRAFSTDALPEALDAVLDDAQNRRRWIRDATKAGAERPTCSIKS